MNKRLLKILFIARDDGGCGFYRIEQPSNFIKRMGLAETQFVLRTPSEDQLLWADLVVLQEVGSTNGSRIAEFLIKNKIPYIVDFDDFVHHVSPHNEAGYPAWNPGTLYIHRAMETARKAAALTVSTNQLAREYFPYNRTIYVVPNYLDSDLWDNPSIKRDDGKTRIGWMGGNAHADDLKMISNVLHKIVKEGKGKVVFETMGMLSQELRGVFPFQEFTASCPHCGYEGELHHFPGESLREYPMVLAGKGWDIAVAPVINTSFNNAKSDIKIKEYSAIGVPIVASPIQPYIEALKNGAKLTLAEDFDGWYKAIKDLIKNPTKRTEIARSNKEWVKQYWIQENAQRIFEAYEQVIHKAGIVLEKR